MSSSKLVPPPRERSESKEREGEPAQADQEDLGHGSRAGSEGQRHAKLQLKQGGVEAKLSRGTQALGTCHTLSYPRPCCHSQRGWQSRASVSPCRGKDWLPPTAAGRGQAAQVLPPDRGSKGKEMWAKSITLGSTTKHKLEMSQASWDMGAAHSVWLPSPDTELCILLFCPLSSSGALGRQTQPYRNLSPQEGPAPQSIPSPALPPPTLQKDREPQAYQETTLRGRCRASIEPRLCQPAGRPGRSHLLHPQLHSLLGPADDHAGESQRPGRSFPWANTLGSRNMQTVLSPWKTLSWPRLRRARTHLMLPVFQQHFQAPS